jgi:NADH:ubiquinone reductase (H+-translocating)
MTSLLSIPRRMARGGVLVVGGGFAGSYVARRLGKTGATVVNPTNFMLYTPLLPEAASGAVEPRRVVVPIRMMCPHAELLIGAVEEIDVDNRIARVRTETGIVDVTFDEIVIALGALSRMPDLPGVREHALPFKDLADAIALRNHVLHQLELADADLERAERRLTFAFVGAGYAGVEALAEAHDLVRDSIRHYPRLRDVPQRWMLVDSGDRVLAQAPERLGAYAACDLARRGIEIRLGTRLDAVDATGASFSDGTRVDTATLVWAAGVVPNPIVRDLGLPVDDRGRVVVDEHLRVDGMPNAWALGDCAAVPNLATPGELDPATCQHALRQARRLTTNMRGTPKPYRYRTLGQVASLGRHRGIARLPGVRLRGFDGWVVARAYHLLQLPSNTRRTRVLADWITSGIFRRDIAELTALNAVGATEVHRA